MQKYAKASGAYIRTLREMHSLTREAVAEKVGTSVSQLVRIEAGIQEPRPSLLFRIVVAVQGDPRHVGALLASDNATADDGHNLARTVDQVIVKESQPHHKTPADVAEIVRYVEEELEAIREEDRRSLGDALRGFLAGFRAGRRTLHQP